MAQSGFTPIFLYSSGTASNVPLAANLTNTASGSEIALNYTDGKLYYKDNGGTVRLLASNATSAPVLTFSGGTTGLTPSTATSGVITLAGTLAVANGGTGNTSGTATINANLTGPVTSVGNATSFTSGMTVPAHTLSGAISGAGNQINNVVIGASTPLAGSFTGVTLTSGTANGVSYLNGSNVLTTGSALTFDGSKFTIAGNSGITGVIVSDVRYTFDVLSYAGAAIGINNSGSTNSYGAPTGVAYFGIAQNYPLVFTVGAAERARIDSSGNLLVGTTTAVQKLTVAGSIAITGANALRGSYGGGGVTSNFAAGDSALAGNTTGSYNTASGLSAMLSNTTGYSNTASGVYALYSNTTGNNNTASGVNALVNNTTGVQNTASGVSALSDQTTANNNTAFGHNTGRGITTGSGNTILGANVTGLAAGLTNNIILASGDGVIKGQFDASGNLGLGVTPSAWGANYKAIQVSNAALSGRITGNELNLRNNSYADGTVDRYLSSNYATTYAQQYGQHQWFSAPSGTAGNAITFTQAMTLSSSGFLGIGATSPAYPIDINAGVNAASIGFSSSIASGTNFKISQGIQGVANGGMSIYDLTNSAVRMAIDFSGNLLIGYTSSNGSYKLQVNSQIFATSATVATSDGRYKKDIQSLEGALGLVNQLNPVQFSWKQHPIHAFDITTPTIGFIAQEVQQVLAGKPYVNSIIKANECVISPEEKDEEGNVTKQAVTEEFLGIAEGNMIALLTKAIQEQQALILTLTNRITALESK